jgi:hypothetical protein
MKSILATHCETLLSSLSQTMKLAPVIPAAGFLADVSAKGPLVPELRTCHSRGCLGQGGIALLDLRVLRDLGDGGQRSDSNPSAAALPDPTEVLHVAKTHQLLHIKYMVPQTSQQVCSSGVYSGAIGGEVFDRLIQRFGTNISKPFSMVYPPSGFFT